MPAVAFVNKMDRIGADFKRAIESTGAKLGGNAAAVQMPIGREDNFTGLVDLLSMSILTFDTDCSSSRAPKCPVVQILDVDNALYN